MDSVVRVGIAVVEHQGRYLVGTRREDQSLAGHAEFPGGRCLPSETARDCAVRECLEEAGLEIVAVRPLHECRHAYPHGAVDLEFWLCRPAREPAAPATESGFRWVPAQSLKSLHFPEANGPVLEILAALRGGAG